MSLTSKASNTGFKPANVLLPSDDTQSVFPSGLKPGRSYADAVRPNHARPEPTFEDGRPVKKQTSSKQGKATPVDASAVVEISTDSEDETRVLADRPLDPGDTMYRGRAHSKSRITSIQQHQDRSPIQTRRAAKQGARPSDSLGQSPLRNADSSHSFNGSSKGASGPRPKPRPVTKRFPKSAPVVVSSDDEMDGKPTLLPSHADRDGEDTSAFSDPDNLPTMAEIFAQVAQQKQPQPRPVKDASMVDRFIDSEAEESGQEGSGDELVCARDDEYDLDDPFIDDSRVAEQSSEAEDLDTGRTRRQSIASSLQMDLDEPYPGIDEDDPLETALKLRQKRRDEHDREMDALVHATGRHRTFLLKALQLLKANEEAEPHVPDDEDRQISLATRESLRDLFAAAGDKRSRSPPKAAPSTRGKGKGRDLKQDPPTEDGDSDEGLSDYERRDRKRLRTALELSKGDKGGVLGESSRATTTPHSQQLPLPSKPLSSPKTPTRGGRKKKGVLEMMEAAGVLPATPPGPSSPPPSTPSSSGFTIESRLLPPPRINEIPLDMNDRVIRLTAAFALYCLSQGISFKSWNENLQGPGFVKFCAWAFQCPDMDGELALAFVVFRSCGEFGNLSRMDLSEVFCLRFGNSTTRYHAVTKEGKPMIFISSGFCDASQVTTPSPVGLKQKSIKVILHEGEHQRLSSASCTVFGFDSMKTQYAKHAIQFSTRAEFTPANGTTGSPGVKAVPSSMFTGASSNTSRISTDSFSLPNTAEVPVYDARDVDDFNVDTDLPKLEEKLPRWKEEVPYGSFVVVGYTMTAFFSSSREWTLGFNIHWVIIVGIPGSKAD